MELFAQKLLRRLEDVDVFGDRKRSAFNPNSRAIALFDELKIVIADIKKHEGEQTIGGSGGKGATRAKASILAELWRDMGKIEETAREMTTLSPIEKAYFVRPTRRELEIVNSAKTFIEKATPLWEKFEAYELASDLLAEMRADVDEYDANYSAQQTAIQNRIGAGSGIDAGLERGQEIIDELRPIVKNKFAGDAVALLEWKSAIRYPERHETPAPTPPTA